jgi:hypothetical protein
LADLETEELPNFTPGASNFDEAEKIQTLNDFDR